MLLWRISEFAALDGTGGLLVEGRWHRKGKRVVYLAESSALAMLEILVHLEVEAVPPPFQLLKVFAPDDLAWDAWPQSGDHRDFAATQDWGSDWIDERKTALVRVPSVIAPFGVNWLLNPSHPDATNVQIQSVEPLSWDHRLLPSP